MTVILIVKVAFWSGGVVNVERRRNSDLGHDMHLWTYREERRRVEYEYELAVGQALHEHPSARCGSRPGRTYRLDLNFDIVDGCVVDSLLPDAFRVLDHTSTENDSLGWQALGPSDHVLGHLALFDGEDTLKLIVSLTEDDEG